MRHMPYARSGCHVRNNVGDTKFPTILVPDVHSSHAIPMPDEAALLVATSEHPSLWCGLPFVPTLRARFWGVGLFLQFHSHAKPLGLVGEFVAHGASGPLVQFLVIGGANIGVLPDSSHIANHHGLHALSVQRGNEPCGLLVFDIGYLLFQFPQLFVFGTNELLAPAGAFLAPADALVHMLDELVAILPLASQESPVENMRLGAIVGNGHVDFAQVDPCYPLTYRLPVCLHRIGCYGLVLCPCPVDDHRLRQFPRPIEHERCITTAVGEPKLPILERQSRTFVLDTEVPFPLVWGPCCPIHLAPFAPASEAGKKRFDTGISGVSMQLLGGEEPLEVLGTQPYAFVSYGTPEEHQGLAVELPALVSKLIELGGLADMHAMNVVAVHLPPLATVS